jgi:hypothetical protein
MDLITVLLIAFGGFTALYAAGWIVVSWTEGQRHNMLFQFDGAVLRLGLESEDEATAFADTFDGRVLSEADARAALDVYAAIVSRSTTARPDAALTDASAAGDLRGGLKNPARSGLIALSRCSPPRCAYPCRAHHKPRRRGSWRQVSLHRLRQLVEGRAGCSSGARRPPNSPCSAGNPPCLQMPGR